MSYSLMIVGCGDVGLRLAERMLVQQWQVYAARRDISQLPDTLQRVALDISNPSLPADWPAQPVDYLVYCVAASQHDAAGYQQAYVDGLRHCLAWLAQAEQAPKRVIFVSSTSVYGQSSGEWVDEGSPAQAAGYSAQAMREAEQLLLGSSYAASVVRLGGIYGPGRQRFISQVQQGCWAPSSPVHFSNRIHADDAAGLLAYLLQADAAGAVLADCYLGVDNQPTALHEVIEWLREQLGVSHRAEQQVQRRGGSKRCSNARARALGWAPQYPSYREGFAALLEAD